MQHSTPQTQVAPWGRHLDLATVCAGLAQGCQMMKYPLDTLVVAELQCPVTALR